MKYPLIEILEIVKVLLNDVPDPHRNKVEINNELLKIYISQAYDEACGVCNRDEMPRESFNSIAFLCVANYRSDKNETISSLSEGGRSVTFANITPEQMKINALCGLSKWKRVRTI